jgi:hypothetical protein
MLKEYVKPTTDWLESSRIWLESNRASFEEAYEENGVHYMDVYFPMNKE